MDWVFQTHWEAMDKAKKWFPLTVHSTIYAAGFIPSLYFFKVNFLWLVLIFLSHFILDQRKLETWLLEKLKGFKKESIPEAGWWILMIGVDQTLHLAVLALITLLS